MSQQSPGSIAQAEFLQKQDNEKLAADVNKVDVLSEFSEMANLDKKPGSVLIGMALFFVLQTCYQFLKPGGTVLKLQGDVSHECSQCWEEI